MTLCFPQELATILCSITRNVSNFIDSTLNESMIERDLEEDVPPPNNEHFDEEKFLGRTAQHINLNSGGKFNAATYNLTRTLT